jgi:UDP-N-acetylglucosamine--N-acetylmuramyl-(pentapeptide) pyrophosphoryl-undecaprenol N-acetylglucosamine transferase
VVAIIGGSLGSALLNGIADEIATSCPSGMHVLHLCGERYAATSTVSSPNVTRIPYTNAMHDVYAASDLVVSRAGASTIAEVSVVGVPCILVPCGWQRPGQRLSLPKPALRVREFASWSWDS